MRQTPTFAINNNNSRRLFFLPPLFVRRPENELWRRMLIVSFRFVRRQPEAGWIRFSICPVDKIIHIEQQSAHKAGARTTTRTTQHGRAKVGFFVQ